MLAATNQIIKSEVEIKNNIDKLREINLKIRLDYVDGKRRETIRKIIMCYKDILAFEEIHYRTTHSHKIEFKNSKAINVQSCRPPECHKDEIHHQINEMFDKQIIEDSDSPFNAPLCVVPKKADASGKQIENRHKLS